MSLIATQALNTLKTTKLFVICVTKAMQAAWLRGTLSVSLCTASTDDVLGVRSQSRL